MKTLKINFGQTMEPCELKKLISFISSDIQEFELKEDRIEFYLQDSADETEVQEKYNRLMNQYCDTKNKEELYYKSDKKQDVFTDLETMQKEGWIKTFGDGLIGFCMDAIPLFQYFSSEFRDFAVEEGAEEKLYPTLLDTKAYQKTGYFQSSPQYVTFCCDVIEDVDCIEKLNGEFEKNNTKSLLSEPQYALSPSACFHTYMEYENAVLPSAKMITFEQKVFRNEGRFNWNEFGRLRDYHVREIVLIGDEDYVKQNRKKIMEKTQKLIGKLGLAGNIISSSDPFIAPKMQQFKKLQVHQKNKYEARIQLSENKSIACASFNLHGVSFTKPFHIKVQDKEHAVTGCVGFGIERWVLAFLSQYGLEKESWPEPVLGFLHKREEISR